MKTLCANGNSIDHWYDRRLRLSVIQTLDSEGNQTGDAALAGDRRSAKQEREWAIQKNGGRKKKGAVCR